MIEEDQGTAVELVKTAVMDHWPRVPVLARGLDLEAKYCWFMLDYNSQGLLVDKFRYPSSVHEGTSRGFSSRTVTTI